MTTSPPADYNQLATELVRACAERDVHALAEVLEYLDPERVDIFVYIHTQTAHLRLMGNYRGLYRPAAPSGVQREPSMSQVAQVLEEVAR